jgi:hypothetical protein
MLVLSGVFNTIILDATNYANQDYMRVNYTYSLHYALSNRQPIKQLLMFCLDMAQWRLVNHCAMSSIGQTWVLASIGAVVEMGVLSTLKRLPMESKN